MNKQEAISIVCSEHAIEFAEWLINQDYTRVPRTLRMRATYNTTFSINKLYELFIKEKQNEKETK